MLNIVLILTGSVSVDRVEFSYNYYGVNINIYFNNLMENPFYNDDYDDYFYYRSFNRVYDVPCILSQFAFRNTHTNEIFQAEYAGTCESYSTNHIQITMNPRDFLRMVVNEFIDTNSTMPLGLEMYTADMLAAPFNLRIEPDDPIEFDLRLNLNYNIGIRYLDYWTDEGILLIHFYFFIDVATVNPSKLLLSRNYNRNVNNTVNITGGEILNQSPGLTVSVAIKLTSNDQDLLASKRICTGDTGNSIRDCYLAVESGFAAAYFGPEVSPTIRGANTIQSAPTGEHAESMCGYYSQFG